MNLSLQRIQPGLPRQSCCPVVHPKRHWRKKSSHLGCLCRVLKISLFVATSITKCFTTCVPSSSHLDRSSLQSILEDSISVSILLSNLLLSCIMSPLRLETDAEGSPSSSIDDTDTRLTWGSSAFGSLKVLALGESAAAANFEVLCVYWWLSKVHLHPCLASWQLWAALLCCQWFHRPVARYRHYSHTNSSISPALVTIMWNRSHPNHESMLLQTTIQLHTPFPSKPTSKQHRAGAIGGL